MLEVATAMSLLFLQEVARQEIAKPPVAMSDRIVQIRPVNLKIRTERDRLLAQEKEVDRAHDAGTLPYADWARAKRDLADAHLRLAMAGVTNSTDDLGTLNMQDAVQNAQRTHQMIANILKANHETGKTVIQNVR